MMESTIASGSIPSHEHSDLEEQAFGLTLPPQNHNVLRRKHIAEGTLFEDPYFPATNKSMFYSHEPPNKFEWKRPQEICSNPKLFVGGASHMDVKQGMLNDSWLLAAVAALSQDQILLNQVVPPNQSWSKNYAGIFYFRFWYLGQWIEVCVDDRLPTYNNKLIFTHSESNNEFWPALLEKAYAKLHGSYEALKEGSVSEAMEDFTGGVVESYDLSKKVDFDLFEFMKRSNAHMSLLTCSIKAITKETAAGKKSSNGLIKGHAYTITDVKEIPVRGRQTQLVRIRNPWGNEQEWTGPWSDNSKEWKLLSNDEKKQHGITFANDGEFWMLFDDFKRNFTDLNICNITLDQFDVDQSVINWNSTIINGSWKEETAGGCQNYPTFTDNPQYVIELQDDADGDGKCSVLIAIMQKIHKQQRRMGVQDLHIGYAIYKAPEGKNRVDKQYVDSNPSVVTSGSHSNSREAFDRVDLPPGRYIIIPSSLKPKEEGEFLLRIFTETAARNDGEDPQKNQLQEMFDRLAGNDKEIDAEELQDILTITLKQDKLMSVFDIAACRLMIAMMDTNDNGTLNFEEFSKLHRVISEWKTIFYKVDFNRSGTMEKDELNEALKLGGFSIAPAILNSIFIRFAKKRKFLNFDDFVFCMASVNLATTHYQEMKDLGEIDMPYKMYLQIALNI